MKYILFFLAGCLLGMPRLSAQYHAGARLAAMAYPLAAVNDLWCVAANPAGLFSASRPAFELSQEQYFFTGSLQRYALAAVLPVKSNFIGLHIAYYGIPEYHEINSSFTYGRSFGPRLAIAIRGKMSHLYTDGFGTRLSVSMDMGINYRFTEDFSAGLYIENPMSRTFSLRGPALPQQQNLLSGLAYRINERVFVAGNITIPTQAPAQYAVGIDYSLSDSINIRSGMGFQALSQHIGFGIKKEAFRFDGALSHQSSIGYSSILSLGYVF